MVDTDNMRIARESIGAWNAHDPEHLVKLLAKEYVAESDTLSVPTHGHEGARQVMKTYVRAFPDLHFDVEQMLASGDHVVTRWRATGTHRGELMGVQPTNRRAETHGCTVGEFKNRKIVREWLYWDTGNLLRQLGVLPTGAPASAAR